MSSPKRHHFVPRAFLQRFACEGKVAVRRRDQEGLIVTSALNVAVESGFYTTEGAGGDKSTKLEGMLADVDGAANNAIAAVVDAAALPSNGSSDRELLASYMALQATRTPEARERVAFPQNVVKYAAGRAIDATLVAEYLRKVHLGYPPSDGEVHGALTMVEYTQQTGSLSRNETVTLPLSTAAGLTPVLLHKHWSLETARKPRFLTSDAPLVAWSKPTPADQYRGTGFANATEIRFPISAAHQVVLTDEPRPSETCVEPGRVRQCNVDIAAGCHKFIVGHPKHPTQLHDVPLAAKRPTLRFNVGPGYRVDANGEDEFVGEILHLWVQRAAPGPCQARRPRRRR